MWREYATHPTPHSIPLPAPFNETLNSFQQLLVLRTLREEKTVFAVRQFVLKQLGHMFTEPPPFDLEGAFGDSDSSTPLIFVLSPGADPVDYLLKLAKEKGKAGTGLRMISLGQGQGPIAEGMMEAARRSGDWVCLQVRRRSTPFLSPIADVATLLFLARELSLCRSHAFCLAAAKVALPSLHRIRCRLVPVVVRLSYHCIIVLSPLPSSSCALV